MSDSNTPRLVVRTVEIADPGDLVALLPAEDPMTWLRRGDGFVAWGRAATFESAGPDRFADASTWWREVVRVAAVADEVGVPGSGLVCLGSFAFADRPGSSVLVVPEVIVGRQGDVAFMTTVGVSAAASSSTLAPSTSW
ncbi:MAG TPA: isochorismate synthase, partial [Marmoricola sp.]